MSKDSKLGVNDYWLAIALIALLVFFLIKESEAAELEIGPTFLSGEYSEGGTLIITKRVGKWSIGGGYLSEQYCHCTFPADLKPNIFIQGQRVFEYKNWELGIGVAYFQNTNRALGEKLNLVSSLGYGGDRWTVRFRHWSNGGTETPNVGQNVLTIGYRF